MVITFTSLKTSCAETVIEQKHSNTMKLFLIDNDIKNICPRFFLGIKKWAIAPQSSSSVTFLKRIILGRSPGLESLDFPFPPQMWQWIAASSIDYLTVAATAHVLNMIPY